MLTQLTRTFKWVAWVAVALIVTFITYEGYYSGQLLPSVAISCFLMIATYVYSAKKAYVYRYMFPGLAAILIFVVTPLLYTFYLGFTNYGGKNLKTFESVTADFLSETYRPANAGNDYDVSLIGDGKEYRVLVTEQASDSGDSTQDNPMSGGASAAMAAPAANATASAAAAAPAPVLKKFVTNALALRSPKDITVHGIPVDHADVDISNALDIRELSLHQSQLDQLTIVLPDGTKIRKTGFSSFGPKEIKYQKHADGSLSDLETPGVVWRPNFDTGYYVNEATQENHIPGFRTSIGFGNYKHIFSDKKFSGPFLAIFAWTVTFAFLSVLCTLSVGMFLAVLLNWESLRLRGLYRMLLFLPYAVPGIIMILVFKGMFNNAGDINLVLDKLFYQPFHHSGHMPAISWGGDPLYARLMVLIVNTWLGYPYMMVLSMGLIKAIPADLYEASAIAGAGPLDNFFKITVPLITKPITPLLIGSFAFNFNNYVLIQLLTAGRPDFLDTDNPAGHTDILVSFTTKLAFEGGQQYGLAAALSTVIFIMVAVLSVLNLRLTRSNQGDRGY